MPCLLEALVESRASEAGGRGVVRLRNWETSELDEIGRFPVGLQEESVELPAVDAGPYINEEGEIEIRVKHFVVATFMSFEFDSRFDVVRIEGREEE